MKPRKSPLRKSRVSTAYYIDRMTTLAVALAKEIEARKAWEDAARDANRAAVKAMDGEREARRDWRKAELEIAWLYDELRVAGREAAANGDYNLRHRVNQLAARRNPEGRQYEGPGT